MTIGEAVADRIEELCKQKGITLNKLSTISGVTQSTLNNITSGVSNNPTISTIKKLCDGLGINIIEFFDTPVFRDLEQEIK
jgi:transcriptional regulator with XRE-family HTH domain